MIIENSKTYNVNDVENLFFRPSFCGKSAEELGIRILYNMPIPTNIPLFSHQNNILQEFSSGWHGCPTSTIEQREIALSKLKAESSYSAESYFSTIYEMLTNSADINLGDLSGTDLEKAETELFRRAIVESIYSSMWFGDTEGSLSDYTAFTGFIRKIIDIKEVSNPLANIHIYPDTASMNICEIFYDIWTSATEELRALSSEGNLAFFVSSDIYDTYQFFLDKMGMSNNAEHLVNGRQGLYYHGIPIVEIPFKQSETYRARSFCILTDRRNLVLALNTADSPEKEIRMWYNPDEMENRQRVVFLAGAAVVDENLVAAAIFDNGVIFLDESAEE
jgi:hypothetical protein